MITVGGITRSRCTEELISIALVSILLRFLVDRLIVTSLINILTEIPTDPRPPSLWKFSRRLEEQVYVFVVINTIPVIRGNDMYDHSALTASSWRRTSLRLRYPFVPIRSLFCLKGSFLFQILYRTTMFVTYLKSTNLNDIEVQLRHTAKSFFQLLECKKSHDILYLCIAHEWVQCWIVYALRGLAAFSKAIRTGLLGMLSSRIEPSNGWNVLQYLDNWWTPSRLSSITSTWLCGIYSLALWRFRLVFNLQKGMLHYRDANGFMRL